MKTGNEKKTVVTDKALSKTKIKVQFQTLSILSIRVTFDLWNQRTVAHILCLGQEKWLALSA